MQTIYFKVNKNIKRSICIAVLLVVLLFVTNAHAQVKLSANGAGETYELINSVLINENRVAVEVPDCNHQDFGRHISEVFDATLQKYVFEFVLHIQHDKDRCKRFDRQRNEIKANNKSSAVILGTVGETINYQWKFKLEKGLQVSSRYTDVHQITYNKTSGNEPLFAFIARKRNGKKNFEIVYINNDEKEVLESVALSKITGKWIVANETITYQKNGSYQLTLRTLDGKTILKVHKKNMQTWFNTMIYARPKWGIYRSLKKQDELRDEKLLFADFEINDVTKH
ncbi:heparin lyase I family protein [Lutibacter holmesii]|uniref:Heparin lyase I family protein n=1 Tax=Lutibacter holmesii TaxID=1137985 RepID=A0ABW3WRD0_9FLAO